MELTSVTVQVPTGRLTDFYTTLAGLFQPETDRLMKWEPADTAIATKVYKSLTPIAGEIYNFLIESADEGFTVEELAETTGRKPSQIRGALSWPTARARNFGKVPIHVQTPDGKVSVTAEVAEVFQGARRSEPQGDTAAKGDEPVINAIKDIVGKEPEGVRYKDLAKRIRECFPEGTEIGDKIKPGSGRLHPIILRYLDQPDSVMYRPSRGLYCHNKYKHKKYKKAVNHK